MTKDELDYAMRFNVSAIFTFMHKNRFTFLKVIDNFKDVYSLNIEDIHLETGEMIEDFLYFMFKYDKNVDDIISSDLDYIEKYYINDFIILKIDKWQYMSKAEWTLMKESNYYDFRGIIYEESKFNNGYTLQHFIIHKYEILAKEISEYIDLDITKENIFWKAFNIEEETLDLSKYKDMTVLGYKKSWLVEEMEKSNLFEKRIYEKVLTNSFEIEVPKITAMSMNKNPNEKLDIIYKKIQNTVFEESGKNQHYLDIKGTKYPFLLNNKDFLDRLQKVIKKYNLEDLDKIEKCLIKHCKKLKSPILKYYIFKDGSSPLVDDYNTYSEETEIINKVINTENLF